MSVRQLVDGDGTLIPSRAYDPFGSVLAASGVEKWCFGFCGSRGRGHGVVVW
jgi:hypothetical protein